MGGGSQEGFLASMVSCQEGFITSTHYLPNMGHNLVEGLPFKGHNPVEGHVGGGQEGSLTITHGEETRKASSPSKQLIEHLVFLLIQSPKYIDSELLKPSLDSAN